MLNFELPIAAEIALPTEWILQSQNPFHILLTFTTNLLKFSKPQKIMPQLVYPLKMTFEKYKPMKLFWRFYGILFKLLCWVNQSLVIRNFLNVTLSKCSRAHVDQVRNSSLKNPYRWYENLRNIPGKDQWWSAVFANLLPIKL